MSPIAAATESSLVTSRAVVVSRHPRSAARARSGAPRLSAFRMLANTRQPRDANRSAVARPIPDELTVIRTDPASSGGFASWLIPARARLALPALAAQQNRQDHERQQRPRRGGRHP